jgi:BRCT domain type II-containing protein
MLERWIHDKKLPIVGKPREIIAKLNSKSPKSNVHTNLINGQVIVFTSVRPTPVMVKQVVDQGGRITTSVSGLTTLVVTSNTPLKKTTEAIKKAKLNKIKIISYSEFEQLL